MLIVILIYFSVLLFISHLTARDHSNSSFFTANRQAPWYIVAFGMLGASLSGVTFISVPGMVISSDMTYMQMVLGFPVGYAIITYILLPLYYKLKLISIYSYFKDRIGVYSYKTAALLFFLSKIIGAAARLYLITLILQTIIFDQLDIPYWITASGTVLMIWLYTFRSGIGTIVWTDTLQTFFMLLALILIITSILTRMDLNLGEAVTAIADSDYSRIFEFKDWESRQNFFKQFMSGIFITIVMTGLDQDMMQKNLACRSLKDSQKNMRWYGLMFIPVNFLFLSLGVLLLLFAGQQNIQLPAVSDEIMPFLCGSGILGNTVMIFFTIGIISAAFSSADSAIAALTTSFCVDLVGIERYKEEKAKRIRQIIHILIAFLFILIILIFRAFNNKSLIDAIYTIASYTYGPLLGLFVYGLYTRRMPVDKIVPFIALLSPFICAALAVFIETYTPYKFGYELLMLNGAITFAGLTIFSKKQKYGD